MNKALVRSTYKCEQMMKMAVRLYQEHLDHLSVYSRSRYYTISVAYLLCGLMEHCVPALQPHPVRRFGQCFVRRWLKSKLTRPTYEAPTTMMFLREEAMVWICVVKD